MSYILDALKKAESERKLGLVPNVHAQPLSTLPPDAPSTRQHVWGWAALAALVVVLSAVAWFKPWQSPVRLTPASADLQEKATPVPIQPPVAIAQNAIVAPAITPAPSPQVSAPPQSAPASRPSSPASAAVEKQAVEIKKAKTEIPPTPGTPEVKAPSAAAPVESAQKKNTESTAIVAAAEPHVGTLGELPENIRKEIPSLAVNGYIYSSKPADRSVLINNRLLREGDQVVPGLTLEKLLPKEAILNYMGYRYRIPY